MDTKNVIAAISLSAAVIILYSLFFAPPPVTKENLAEKNKVFLLFEAAVAGGIPIIKTIKNNIFCIFNHL